MKKDIFDDIHEYLEAVDNAKDSDIILTLYDQILLDKINNYSIEELSVIAGSRVPSLAKICQEKLIQKSPSKVAYQLLRTLAKNSNQETLTQDNLEWIIEEGSDALRITLVGEEFPLTENQLAGLIQNGSDDVIVTIARSRSESDRIIGLIVKKNSHLANLALIESGNLPVYWATLLAKESDESIKIGLYNYTVKKLQEETDFDSQNLLISLRDSLKVSLSQTKEKTS